MTSVYANKIMRDFQSDYGLNEKPRIKNRMLENSFKKGGMSWMAKQLNNIEKFLKLMDSSEEGATRELS